MVFCSSVGEQKVISDEDVCGSVPGVGCECIVLCYLGFTRC